jgi:sulfur carrier protein
MAAASESVGCGFLILDFSFWRPGAMEITVNGKLENVSSDSIAAYILAKGVNPKALVVEHNGRVIAQEKWDRTPLCQGDHLELLSFVGGG